jgi:SAM-dependent methyltransferase
MKEFWDERYSEAHYAYGEEPNEFLRQWMERHPPGRALFPAEGEGRNAVYAARCGWTVEAFDISEAGRRKALQLADRHQVKLEYNLLGAAEYRAGGPYDLVALIFAHFPPEVRGPFYSELIRSLAPGGVLLLEAFGLKQLGNRSGGPHDPALLYTVDELAGLCRGLHLELLHEARIELDEGPFHQGAAEVVRLLARK